MLCPACKTPVPESAYQCPACGTTTPVDADATQMFAEETFADPDTDLTQATPEPRGWSKPFTPSDVIAYRSVSLGPGSVLGGPLRNFEKARRGRDGLRVSSARH